MCKTFAVKRMPLCSFTLSMNKSGNLLKMQVTINSMSQSKTVPRVHAILASLGLCLLFALGQTQARAQSTGPAQQKPATGTGTATRNPLRCVRLIRSVA